MGGKRNIRHGINRTSKSGFLFQGLHNTSISGVKSSWVSMVESNVESVAILENVHFQSGITFLRVVTRGAGKAFT